MEQNSSILLDEKIKGTLYSLRISQHDKQQAHFDLIMRGRWTWASTECTTLTEPEIRFHMLKIMETIGDAISKSHAEELTNKVLSLFLPEFKQEMPIETPSPVPSSDLKELQIVISHLQNLEQNIQLLDSKMEAILKQIGELGDKFHQLEIRMGS